MRNSETNSFLKCPMLYKLQFVDNVKPIEEPLPLRFGTLFHLGMETNDIFPKGADELEFNQQKMLEGMIKLALRKNKYDESTPKEIKLQTHLTPDVTLDGTIDEIRDGYICDWKTASNKVNEDMYKPQMIKYVWLARQNGYDVKGAKLKILYKTKIRLKRTENEYEFANRILLEYEDDEKYYEELVFEFTDEEIKDELENFINVYRLIKCNIFPKNYGECNKFGKCKYYALCNKLEGAEYLYEKERI
jgi:hypothetical protein